MSNIKDTLTTIFAIVSVIAGAVNAYLQSQTGEINWAQLAIAVVVAVIAYFTGKKPDGTKKSAEEVADQNAK